MDADEPFVSRSAADVAMSVARLTTGAASWAGRGPAARGELALRTARATERAADAWVREAGRIKQAWSEDAGAAAGASVVRAEETATGPLATLRLLLVTAGSLMAIGRTGLPSVARPPRHLPSGAGGTPLVEVDLLPAAGPRGWLFDHAIFAGHAATVRCVDPGGLEAFDRSWREEVVRRPQGGGVAVVLGAGNVTGLGPADCICQIFEHGRAALLKLHPLHAPLAPILRDALGPLMEAGLLDVVAGGPELAREAVRSPGVTHVHLTGGRAAFDALVWGGRQPVGRPVLERSISCELGSVSPWVVMPGRYTARELASQADMVAASIVNNTSFNCIATKLVVTAESWEQREAFLAAVERRLAAVPARPAWYPGSTSAWEAASGRRAPGDGRLPWAFRSGVDPDAEPQVVDREWFVPVVAEVPLEADSLEAFCTACQSLCARLPGTLAASVTLPRGLGDRDARTSERLIEHLRFGVVAVNTWSAIGYSLGNVPWGGFPGATLAEPASGLGFVHDPLLLPLVRNTILRGPLVGRWRPAWFPWHPHAAALARGLVDLYGRVARGESGLWPLLRMLPAVCTGG